MGCPDDGVEAISLYEAGKRLGLGGPSNRNASDWLNPLCFRGGIEVRYEVDGIPAIRASDLERLRVLVERWRNRPRIWPKRTGKNPARAPYRG